MAVRWSVFQSGHVWLYMDTSILFIILNFLIATYGNLKKKSLPSYKLSKSSLP